MIAWVKNYNNQSYDIPVAIVLDSSNNIFVTGVSGYAHAWGAYDRGQFATIKYDVNGNELWVWNFGGYGYSHPYDMKVDSSGNIYITGHSGVGWDYDHYGSGSYVTVKYDPQGNELWSTTFGCGSYDISQAIGLDIAGNMYVTGTCGSDYVTLKYTDTNNPVITINEPQPNTVLPPSNKINSIALSGTIIDIESGISEAYYSVTDEYHEVEPNGTITLTPSGSFSLDIPLELLKRGNDADGRLYIINITTRDFDGNTSATSTSVIINR